MKITKELLLANRWTDNSDSEYFINHTEKCILWYNFKRLGIIQCWFKVGTGRMFYGCDIHVTDTGENGTIEERIKAVTGQTLNFEPPETKEENKQLPTQEHIDEVESLNWTIRDLEEKLSDKVDENAALKTKIKELNENYQHARADRNFWAKEAREELAKNLKTRKLFENIKHEVHLNAVALVKLHERIDKSEKLLDKYKHQIDQNNRQLVTHFDRILALEKVGEQPESFGHPFKLGDTIEVLNNFNKYALKCLKGSIYAIEDNQITIQLLNDKQLWTMSISEAIISLDIIK